MSFYPDAAMFGVTGDQRAGRGDPSARHACVSLDASRDQR
jgi:hypothetical protein